MCYFDQTRWICGYWKWENFRAQCPKEYRTGETCGLKLVYETILQPTVCKLCDQMEKKHRRMAKMREDIARWEREGNRRATIDKTSCDIQEIEVQINDIWRAHVDRTRNI